ncbi:hypothetical protein BAU15_14825 [Enterococcus sp. JM4C]|uniref:metallophosphoesterase family protein n=1 Tax=Candidatus Enterococcus huntleyi TaxID=1857217 RepID=UPI00137B8D5C|nr:metallophosphoesterase family protein [Enterococcus sp. JM4C]KAF1296612.1 hypothetical protein BAU15_14825 [Enterococcus sp. JM4C]
MTKVLLVGDLHLKSKVILPIVEETIEQYEVEQVVMLGDYLDDWNCSQDSQLYWEELTFLVRWKNKIERSGVKVVTLLGNHDAPYLTGELRNYSLNKAFDIDSKKLSIDDVISDKLMELGVQIAYQLDDFLVSHAGYHQGQPLEKWHLRKLTLSDLDLRNVKELENRISTYRGGYSLNPSPLWTDFYELIEFCNPKYPKQIVGHTPQKHIVLKTNSQIPYQLIDIDTFSLSTKATYPYYEFKGNGDLLFYHDGELSIINTRWRNKETLEKVHFQRGR